jgi:hypothetical protein
MIVRLDVLDAKVGKGKYVVVLTADHGVCPLPEVSKAQGRVAARVPPLSGTKTEAFLVEKFGKATVKWVQAISGPWVYLNDKAAVDRGVKRARFVVLKHAPCPAVLVETGFVSNRREEIRFMTDKFRDVSVAVKGREILGHRLESLNHHDLASLSLRCSRCRSQPQPAALLDRSRKLDAQSVDLRLGIPLRSRLQAHRVMIGGRQP